MIDSIFTKSMSPSFLQIKPSELSLMIYSSLHSVPRFLISSGRSSPVQQQLHLSETWLVYIKLTVKCCIVNSASDLRNIKVIDLICLVPVRLFPWPSWYPMTSLLVSVTYLRELPDHMTPNWLAAMKIGLGTRQRLTGSQVVIKLI